MSTENLDPRCRARRPDRVELGDDVAVRNDLVARQDGIAERTLNRYDGQGAPFIMIGGVKYRPERAYREWLAGRVVRRNPPRKGRAVR
jgi:hypothetical protein